MPARTSETEQPTSYVMGLDLGSKTTRCVILRSVRGLPTFSGWGAVPSSGWAKGEVANPEKIKESILRAIQIASKGNTLPIAMTALGVGHRLIRTTFREFDPKSGLSSLFESWDPPQELAERGVVVMWKNNSLIPPDNTRWITVPTAALEAYDSLLQGLPSNKFQYVFEPLAASTAATTYKQRVRGIFLVDIGFESSGCVFWDKGIMRSAFGMNVSGSQLTRNFAFQQDISKDYGLAIQRKNSKNYLDILDAHSKNFAGMIIDEIIAHGVEIDTVPEDVILVGEASKAYGLSRHLSKYLSAEVTLGSPSGIVKLPKFRGDAGVGWCLACGLALNAFESKFGGNEPRTNAVRRHLSQSDDNGVFRQVQQNGPIRAGRYGALCLPQ